MKVREYACGIEEKKAVLERFGGATMQIWREGFVLFSSFDSAEKPPGKKVGTEPAPSEYAKNSVFSLLEGRPPCRPQGFSAESSF